MGFEKQDTQQKTQRKNFRNLTNNLEQNLDASHFSKQNNSCTWTVEEDELLKKSVALIGVGNWKKIAQRVRGRSALQCFNRWTKKSLTSGMDKKLEKKERVESFAAWTQKKHNPKPSIQTDDFATERRSQKRTAGREFDELESEMKKKNCTEPETLNIKNEISDELKPSVYDLPRSLMTPLQIKSINLLNSTQNESIRVLSPATEKQHTLTNGSHINTNAGTKDERVTLQDSDQMLSQNFDQRITSFSPRNNQPSANNPHPTQVKIQSELIHNDITNAKGLNAIIKEEKFGLLDQIKKSAQNMKGEVNSQATNFATSSDKYSNNDVADITANKKNYPSKLDAEFENYIIRCEGKWSKNDLETPHKSDSWEIPGCWGSSTKKLVKAHEDSDSTEFSRKFEVVEKQINNFFEVMNASQKKYRSFLDFNLNEPLLHVHPNDKNESQTKQLQLASAKNIHVNLTSAGVAERGYKTPHQENKAIQERPAKFFKPILLSKPPEMLQKSELSQEAKQSSDSKNSNGEVSHTQEEDKLDLLTQSTPVKIDDHNSVQNICNNITNIYLIVKMVRDRCSTFTGENIAFVLKRWSALENILSRTKKDLDQLEVTLFGEKRNRKI